MNKKNRRNGVCCPPGKRDRQIPEFDARHYKVRAAVLKALAHPVRLFIVDCLEQREHCVSELTDHVGLDQSTVSKHLAVLRATRIVDDDKRGRETWYRLGIPCVAGFFSCIEEALEHSGGLSKPGSGS